MFLKIKTTERSASMTTMLAYPECLEMLETWLQAAMDKEKASFTEMAETAVFDESLRFAAIRQYGKYEGLRFVLSRLESLRTNGK